MNLPIGCKRLSLLLATAITLLLVACTAGADGTGETNETHDVVITEIATGIPHPWGMAFLPDESILVTARPGRLLIVEEGSVTELAGAPEVAVAGQGGLLDVAIHPNYDSPGNGWIYFTYSKSVGAEFATALGRGRIEGSTLVDRQELFVMNEASNTTRHFGSRIVFGSDGYLYISIGDRGARERAQDTADHAGSTLRLTDTGQPAPGNPLDAPALPEIYSYGHRNPQGMAVHPISGALWQHEHGPRGGDELNIIRPGKNYGWPIVTYGREYSTGEPIGDPAEEHPEVVLPLVHWSPDSIAPSGMAFYTGSEFPGWRGDLFLGALAGTHLRRLELADGEVVEQELFLEDRGWRIRDVAEGPDGLIYILTDAENGGLYRLAPAE